jgi:hypothetical protein
MIAGIGAYIAPIDTPHIYKVTRARNAIATDFS